MQDRRPAFGRRQNRCFVLKIVDHTNCPVDESLYLLHSIAQAVVLAVHDRFIVLRYFNDRPRITCHR